MSTSENDHSNIFSYNCFLTIQLRQFEEKFLCIDDPAVFRNFSMRTVTTSVKLFPTALASI